jgi:hypothetical protein
MEQTYSSHGGDKKYIKLFAKTHIQARGRPRRTLGDGIKRSSLSRLVEMKTF